jgi:hypothetical protein
MDYEFISALLTTFFTQGKLKWFCSIAYLAMGRICPPFLPCLLGFLSAVPLAALKLSGSDESVAMPRFPRWGQGCTQNDGYESIYFLLIFFIILTGFYYNNLICLPLDCIQF